MSLTKKVRRQISVKLRRTQMADLLSRLSTLFHHNVPSGESAWIFG
jgi:hypothetical protein